MSTSLENALVQSEGGDEVKPLFKGDIKAQSIKLMEMLTVAIATLNDREGLAILLRRLGLVTTF